MLTLNNYSFIGNATKDPEDISTPEMKKIKFRIAVNYGKDKTCYWTVVAYNQNATYAQNYIKKGDIVCGSGRIEQWEDKDGNTRYTIICDKLGSYIKRDRQSDDKQEDNIPF